MSNFVSPYAWISDNGGEEIWTFLAEEDNIMCRICRYKCPFSPPSRMKRHLACPTHIRNVELFRKHVIHEDIDSGNFNTDLTKMLVSCNIPLATVDHPNFKKFLEKYVGKSVPSRKSTIRLVGEVSKDVICKVKEEVEGKDIFIAVDETKDNRDRPMTSILIGPLDGYFLYRPYLINLTDISTENPNNIVDFVVQSIEGTLGNSFNKARLKVFVTDGKPHCKKAGEDLQRVYPQLEHISPTESGLDNVDGDYSNKCSEEIQAISEVNKMFLSSGHRKRSFLTMMKSIYDTRSRLSVNTLKDLLIIKWNCKFTDL
uniref:Uncharacterized protein n=1 Tax=Lepeophtheirus salmonis TaxID=72036 RepID=A0A0K2TX91_LEPSM